MDLGRRMVLEGLRDAAVRASEEELGEDQVLAAQCMGVAVGIQLALHGDLEKLLSHREGVCKA